ncbi:MAG: hypothetical protein WAO12_11795 [Venatoribacter sp.]
MSILSRLLLISAFLGTLSGCSTIYGTAGKTVYSFTENYAIPHTLKSTDTGYACSMSGSMLPVLTTFSDITRSPDLIATTMNMLMGLCAESVASEHLLSYARAYREQNVNAAKDSRIKEKRAYAVAASRQYASFQYLSAKYGEPGGKCPKINKEDEIHWLLGNVAGLQAVLSDLKAESSVNVPKDIAMKATRGLQCLDNEKWWGLPQAMQAGIWLMMPGSGPEGVDPWDEMKAAEKLGTKGGVRFAFAIEAIIADSTGHTQELKDAIRRYGESMKENPGDKKYALIDVLSAEQIQIISDRLWTENTGSRTPFGGLGTFWDDVKVQNNTVNIDDLLED